MKSKDLAKWVIKVPAKAKIFVKLGDEVEMDDKLLLVKSSKVEKFDLSGMLSKLAETDLEDLNQKFLNKMVEAGELLYSFGFSIFGNKICFPMGGICLGIDEFKNLKIESIEEEEKTIYSPVKAKVAKLEEGKLVLEFKVKEYAGRGINSGKAWAESRVKEINEIKDLNYEIDNGVLFTKNLDRGFLFKAEVLGARAVVIPEGIVKDENNLKINLPILELSSKKWDSLFEEYNDKNEKFLVNSRTELLLLVLE